MCVDAAPLVGEHHLEARVDGRVWPQVTARQEASSSSRWMRGDCSASTRVSGVCARTPSLQNATVRAKDNNPCTCASLIIIERYYEYCTTRMYEFSWRKRLDALENAEALVENPSGTLTAWRKGQCTRRGERHMRQRERWRRQTSWGVTRSNAPENVAMSSCELGVLCEQHHWRARLCARATRSVRRLRQRPGVHQEVVDRQLL